MNPKPFNTGYLEEQDGHKVYFAEYGNSKGEIIVTYMVVLAQNLRLNMSNLMTFKNSM